MQPQSCPQCRQVNEAGRTSCHACLAPLTGPGFVAPKDALPYVRRGAMWGSMVAAVALAGTLVVSPNSPLSSLLRANAAPEAAEAPTAPQQPSHLGKFEPESGCYLGAYVLADINISGKMERWEELTGKGHASYLKYVGYGRPFPTEWATAVRGRGAAPNIAFEPNDGLGKVEDAEYLRGFAREAAKHGGPVFLRFASEMNGPWTNYHGSHRGNR
ncbi:MAG: hypothetical protein ACO1SX_11175, partial [Actinomycetota bacterium]